MLMVDGMTVGVYASRLDAMAELATLIKVMSEKEIIDKEDALVIVEAAFMSAEDLKKKAEEAKANIKKSMDDKLKELLKEMLEELE